MWTEGLEMLKPKVVSPYHSFIYAVSSGLPRPSRCQGRTDFRFYANAVPSESRR